MRYITTALAVMAISIFISSCSNDDEYNDKNIEYVHPYETSAFLCFPSTWDVVEINKCDCGKLYDVINGGTWKGQDFLNGKEIATQSTITFKDGKVEYTSDEISIKDEEIVYSPKESWGANIKSKQIKGKLLHLGLDGKRDFLVLGMIMHEYQHSIIIGVRVKRGSKTIKDFIMGKEFTEAEYKQYTKYLVYNRETEYLWNYDWVFRNFLKYD